jgi:hypothetical protein
MSDRKSPPDPDSRATKDDEREAAVLAADDTGMLADERLIAFTQFPERDADNAGDV